MDDSKILQQINAMIEAEHELRRQHEEAGGPDAETTNKLRALEESLDRCWGPAAAASCAP